MKATFLVALLLLGVLLAGCGGPKGPSTPAMDGHQRYVIHMTGANRFTPMDAKLPVNATVVWVNDAGVHDITADDGTFRSPRTMASGAEWDFKFTKPGTTVDLRVRHSADRVRIEVQDECGGLPGGCPDDLFRPFELRGPERSGLGLGLAFSRKVVQASRGTISVRNIQGHGCVFAIDLPRSLGPATHATTGSAPHQVQ